uniref:Flavin containing amine oxidoreductase n=1 Tax=Pithovirus LCPAC304 TaxID=2506594 RepID=A0A481ZAT3_9VIRU|nr:MAG: flavin containing amine oxidoreductase [Pithovirus LCPAC304]
MPHIARLRKSFGRGLSSSYRHEILRRVVDEHTLRQKELKCPKTRQKVGIVGAGYAGLYCGWLLTKLGVDVTVFEAMDRVGGRVHSLYDFSKGRVVEAGAELIGLNHGAMLALMRRFGLALVDVPSEDQNLALQLVQPIVLNGRVLSRKETKQLEKELDVLLMRISEAAKIIRFPDRPWLESEAVQQLDTVSIADVLDRWGIHGDLRTLFDLETDNDNVADVSQQSWLGLLCQVRGGSLCCEPREFWDVEELFRSAEGNQKLAECLAKEIPTIHLNTPIRKIKYHPKTQTFTLFSKYKKSTFDYVVLATPPSMWRKIQFSPAVDLRPYLPALGPAVKYLSTIESRFWIPEKLAACGISNLIGETWESTGNQTDNGRQYYNFIVFAGGKNAQKAIDLQKRGEKKVFRHFRKGVNVSYNGQFTKNLVDETLSFHSTIPFLETGYSYMKVGKVLTTGQLDNLPFEKYDGNLFFAGEYTSMVYYGYMEGALQSAIGVVELLTSRISRGKQ